MRIFVTGASGFVGSAVVQDLLAAGHEVTGLARSDASAAKLEAAGAQVHRGTLEDPATIVEAARAADGVAHLAFDHDFSAHGSSIEKDLRVVTALADALAGSDRPLVVTSGLAMVAPGRVALETDQPVAPKGAPSRLAAEHVTREAAARGVRGVVLRLSPTVHGEGDHGFVAAAAKADRAHGAAAFPGDGTSRWSAVHRSDAARLFRLALESAPAGSTLHAAGEEGVAWKDIAEALGRGMDLPVKGLDGDALATQFGWLARFVAADMPASAAATRELLGWEPTGPTLLADIEAGHYTY